MMALDISAFESLVPSRFVTFSFPYPLPTWPLPSNLRVAVFDSPISQVGRRPRIAAMLVPQNREDDWIFSTESGHLQLLLSFSPQLSRLILIGKEPSGNGGSSTLNIYPRIENMTQLELGEALTPLLDALSPKLCPMDVPILQYEDELLSSVIREKCVGSMVGEMLIEDVEIETHGGGDGSRSSREFRRRLRFKRMPNLIQTQVRIVPDVDLVRYYLDISAVRFRVDTTVLVHPYLAPMVAALSLLGPSIDEKFRRKKRPKVLCLGVGGGALISFLSGQLDFEVFGVEGDGEVLRVAKEYFGLEDSELVNIVVGDAMEVVEKLAGGMSNPGSGSWNKGSPTDIKFDVVMVDLDSGDVRTGLVAPPWEFVSETVLVALRSILCKSGILVVNVIPPDRSFYDRLLSEFRKIFVDLYEIDVRNGENFVVIATVATATDSFQMKLKSFVPEAYMESIKKI